MLRQEGAQGLLGFAGFLALHAGPAETSVTKRGFFVVSKLLCRAIPPPPDDLVAQLPESLPGEHRTMRPATRSEASAALVEVGARSATGGGIIAALR